MSLLKVVREFLNGEGNLIDVRTPQEFSRGHIPGAKNLPLLSDEEHAAVGKTYKKKEADAIALGWDIVTKKLPLLLEKIEEQFASAPARLYCFRGGMRSEGMHHLFTFAGIPANILPGGYKTFRSATQELYLKDADYQVIGGFTATGKTETLQELERLGEQVIDLESLANHRGSTFGNIKNQKQPSTEQFHNRIALKLLNFNLNKTIWIEDESRLIGECHLPEPLYHHLSTSPLIILVRSMEERLQILKRTYCAEELYYFSEGIKKLEKKLGNEATENLLSLIEKGDLKEAACILLHYYDKRYCHALSKRKRKTLTFETKHLEADACARFLITLARN